MKFLIPPWKHQLDAIEVASQKENFAFFFEMGAGKTSTCINTIRKVWNEKKRQPRVLIFCPPIVVKQWKEEWLKHSNIPEKDIVLLQGSGEQRWQKLAKHGFTELPTPRKPQNPVPKIFVANYQTLLMDDVYLLMQKYDAEVVVFDESHKLKSVSSKTAKRADLLVNHKMKATRETDFKLVGPRPMVYLLTGTPILNNLSDIFQQYKIMDAGHTFGHNYWAFRGKYLMDKNAGMPKSRYFPLWVPRPGAFEKMSEKIKDSSMRVLKKDCMDLPPFLRVTKTVTMSPAHRRVYNSMLKDFIAFFEQQGHEKTVAATLAITKGLKLMQMASGFIKDVEGKEFNFIDDGKTMTPKQEALHDLLSDLTPSHKVLVWCVWKKNYEQIEQVCKSLDIKYVALHGDITEKQKEFNVKTFNEDPSVRVLFGHPKSGGIGVNLTAASYSIFFSRSFSREEDEQAEARNYRGGSTIHEKITRIDLITEDTIEEKIVEALAKKVEISDKILREITLEEAKK